MKYTTLIGLSIIILFFIQCDSKKEAVKNAPSTNVLNEKTNHTPTVNNKNPIIEYPLISKFKWLKSYWKLDGVERLFQHNTDYIVGCRDFTISEHEGTLSFSIVKDNKVIEYKLKQPQGNSKWIFEKTKRNKVIFERINEKTFTIYYSSKDSTHTYIKS